MSPSVRNVSLVTAMPKLPKRFAAEGEEEGLKYYIYLGREGVTQGLKWCHLQ
jgi:hypothetical protein